MFAVEPESDILDLLDRLTGLGETCKCGDGRPIQECPNYVEGDEEEIEDDEPRTYRRGEGW